MFIFAPLCLTHWSDINSAVIWLYGSRQVFVIGFVVSIVPPDSAILRPHYDALALFGMPQILRVRSGGKYIATNRIENQILIVLNMLIEERTTKCRDCNNPLTWTAIGKRLRQGSDVYELDFRCETCKREYRFTDGTLKELKIERDPVAEQLAMRKAEIDAFRGCRCPKCGGPLDGWLTCEWCHERYSVEDGVLVPRPRESLPIKRRMSDFYGRNR